MTWGFLGFLPLWSSVSSTSGVLDFDADSDLQAEARLTGVGLGIGISSPSANLHVMGNGIIGELHIGGSGMSSNLNVYGSLSQSYTSYSAGTNAISGQSVVFADSSAGNIKLTLPSAEGFDGKIVWIKKTSVSHELVIKPDNNLIDGDDLIVVGSGNLSFHQLVSSGNQWYRLSDSSHQSSLSTYSNNLIVHYRFDELSGNAIKDSAASHNGELMDAFTFSGCTESGKLGQGLFFDGVRNRAKITRSASMVPSGNTMTIMAWVKPKTLDANMTVIRLNNSYDMRVTGGDFFLTKVDNQDSTQSAGTPSPGQLTVDTWHHLAAVVTNDQVSTYLDGVFQASDALSFTSIGSSGTTELFLGDADETDNTVNNFHGTIDEVRVYDRALTADELLRMVDLTK